MNQAQSVSCRASRVVVVAPRYSRTLKIAISARGASQIDSELAGRAGQHAAASGAAAAAQPTTTPGRGQPSAGSPSLHTGHSGVELTSAPGELPPVLRHALPDAIDDGLLLRCSSEMGCCAPESTTPLSAAAGAVVSSLRSPSAQKSPPALAGGDDQASSKASSSKPSSSNNRPPKMQHKKRAAAAAAAASDVASAVAKPQLVPCQSSGGTGSSRSTVGSRSKKAKVMGEESIQTAVGVIWLHDNISVRWVGDGSDGQFYAATVTSVWKNQKGLSVTYPESEEYEEWEEGLPIDSINCLRVLHPAATAASGAHEAPGASTEHFQLQVAVPTRVASASWTDAEDTKLIELVDKDGEGEWLAKAVLLGTKRTARACQTRYRRYLRCRQPRSSTVASARSDKRKAAVGKTVVTSGRSNEHKRSKPSPPSPSRAEVLQADDDDDKDGVEDEEVEEMTSLEAMTSLKAIQEACQACRMTLG
jgi:hypothetical protein